jgi:hypothetical protein
MGGKLCCIHFCLKKKKKKKENLKELEEESQKAMGEIRPLI